MLFGYLVIPVFEKNFNFRYYIENRTFSNIKSHKLSEHKFSVARDKDMFFFAGTNFHSKNRFFLLKWANRGVK